MVLDIRLTRNSPIVVQFDRDNRFDSKDFRAESFSQALYNSTMVDLKQSPSAQTDINASIVADPLRINRQWLRSVSVQSTALKVLHQMLEHGFHHVLTCVRNTDSEDSSMCESNSSDSGIIQSKVHDNQAIVTGETWAHSDTECGLLDVVQLLGGIIELHESIGCNTLWRSLKHRHQQHHQQNVRIKRAASHCSNGRTSDTSGRRRALFNRAENSPAKGRQNSSGIRVPIRLRPLSAAQKTALAASAAAGAAVHGVMQVLDKIQSMRSDGEGKVNDLPSSYDWFTSLSTFKMDSSMLTDSKSSHENSDESSAKRSSGSKITKQFSLNRPGGGCGGFICKVQCGEQLQRLKLVLPYFGDCDGCLQLLLSAMSTNATYHVRS